ncbi:MAG: hypothetical protein J4452_03455 [Candidatus Aenigmarchaeota archaeon]|nr:hypothetical protein [Candidatus Aenigmarchaeota archaeon]
MSSLQKRMAECDMHGQVKPVVVVLQDKEAINQVSISLYCPKSSEHPRYELNDVEGHKLGYWCSYCNNVKRPSRTFISSEPSAGTIDDYYLLSCPDCHSTIGGDLIL